MAPTVQKNRRRLRGKDHLPPRPKLSVGDHVRISETRRQARGINALDISIPDHGNIVERYHDATWIDEQRAVACGA